MLEIIKSSHLHILIKTDHLYENKDGRCAAFNIIKLELRRLLILNNRYGKVLAECIVHVIHVSTYDCVNTIRGLD